MKIIEIKTIEEKKYMQKKVDRIGNVFLIVFYIALISFFEKVMPGQINKDIESIMEFISSKIEELCTE